MFLPLGKIVIDTPGVPKRITNNLLDPSLAVNVHGFAIQRLKSNAGDVYVTLSSSDDRINLRYIMARLDRTQPSFSAGIGIEVNGTNMSVIYIDADTAGDGVTCICMVS
jgi:hypothetical protein